MRNFDIEGRKNTIANICWKIPLCEWKKQNFLDKAYKVQTLKNIENLHKN